MKEWFAQLNQREQMSLVALGLVLLLYLLYVLLWSPLDERRAELALQNAALAESQARVDAMVHELLQLRQSGTSPGAARNLTVVINETTTRLRLPVTRLQPNARGEIQVRLENAVFDDVIKWLYEMEFGESLLVREIAVTPANASGRVNATALIAEAG